MNSFIRAAQVIGRSLLRALLALLALGLLLGALLAGALLALGLAIWALLRGRRLPPVRDDWRGFPSPRRSRRVPPGAAGAGEVVDIEASEVRKPREVHEGRAGDR